MKIQSQQQKQHQGEQQKEIFETYYSNFVDDDDDDDDDDIQDDEDTQLFERKQQQEQRDDVDDGKQITYQRRHMQQSHKVVQSTTTTSYRKSYSTGSTVAGQDECITGNMREQQKQQQQQQQHQSSTVVAQRQQQQQQQQQPQYSSANKKEKNIQNQQNCHYSLARVIEMKARIRKRLNSNGSTNVNYNDVNIYNDGDQSPVCNLKHQYTLHELFYTGGEISLILNEHNWGSKLTVSLPPTSIDNTKTAKSLSLLKKSSKNKNDDKSLPTIQLGGLSEFAMHCISGHYQKVRTILESKTVKAGCTIDSITKLVEKRETTLRLSPLLLVIVANTRLSTDTSTSTGTTNTSKLLKYAKSTNRNDNQKQDRNIHHDDDDEVGVRTKSCLSMKLLSLRNSKTSSTIPQQHDGKSPGCYNFDLSPRHRDKAMNPVTNFGTHQQTDANNNNTNDDDIVEMCEWSYNQLCVIKLLLEYGARPDVKDVCGKTVVHYGAGIDATVMSLKAVDMCCRAYHSAYLFNQEVIICTTTEQLIKNNIQQIQQQQESTGTSTNSTNTSANTTSKQDEITIMHSNDPNVVSTTCMTFKKQNDTTTSTTNNTNSNTPSRIARMLRLNNNNNNNNNSNGNKQGSLQELNGKQGIAQGYIVDTGCRIVYIFGQTDEIRTLKPYQMELVSKSDTNNNKNTNNSNNITIIQPSKSESNNSCTSSRSSTTTTTNKNLCNIPDRMGRVPIVELYDTNRLDVAEFLLLQQKASIYVRTGWNTNRNTTTGTSKSTTGTITVHDNNTKNTNTSNNPELSTAATSAVKRVLSNLSENNDTVGIIRNDNSNTNLPSTIKEAFLNINLDDNNKNKNTTSNVKNSNNTTKRDGQVDDFENTLLYNVLMSRDKSTVSQLIYALAIQQIQKEQKLLRNRCSQCNIDTTITNIPLRVCEQCLSVRFCSRECQRIHWNNGHKHHCKELAKERNTFVLVTPESLLHRYSSHSNHGTSSPRVGIFQKPRKVEYGEPFVVKIQHLQQGGDDILWIYNKERDCEFFLYYDKNASSNCKNQQYDHRTTIDGSGGGIYSIANSILQGSTHSNNTSTTTCNIDKSGSNIGYNDLIDKIQSVQRHLQDFKSSGQVQQQYKNTKQSSFWSPSNNSNNASMYITAVFENEQCCKLYIHQTKIKTW